MFRYIRLFEEIGRTDVSVAGGKGANLGEMVCAGIPVPEGAVLTAESYDVFIRENGIDIASLLKNGSSEQESSKRIRSLILNAAIPRKIEAEIRSFYLTLGEGARVAVRSSATAEDLEDASFAGQQETFLNVRTFDDLMEKIKECYASLWGVRAIHYRNTTGYGKADVSLAVVIQRMVESESAGVLFTKDPAKNTDDILINASFGLGEAVVSGIVSPDEYIADRDGRIQNIVIGNKEVMIVYSEQGTEKKAVDETLRNSRVLSDEMVRTLTLQALRIEQHYGHPMDIEWAVREGEVYILQARAITTIPSGNERIFTEQDFAGLPKAKPATGKFRENILFNLEKLPRPYLPLDHDFGDKVGQQKERLLAEAGIKMNEMIPINEDGISSFSISGMRPTGRIVKLPALLRQMKKDALNIKISTDELNACTELYRRECDTKHLTIRELGESLKRMNRLIERTAYARFRYAIFPQVMENVSLNKTLAKIDRSFNSYDLLEGLSYVTADINREMALLASEIRKDSALADAVMQRSYAELISEYPVLGDQFQEFMEKYGNRSDFNCYCFVARSWNDEPDRFLCSLRTVLRGKDTDTPSLEDGKESFAQLMCRVKNCLGDRAYERFERKVTAVRHYHVIREATQYLWESEFALCRKLLRETARLLGEDYEHLLYLFEDELYEICEKGVLDEPSRRKILRRKEKRPLAEEYWSRSISIMLDTGSADIAGVCGSGGKATGKAYVVKGPEEFGKLEEGGILVCPYTDPEWTPLFTLAAGVVVDTGGTLSHAAIVAREYKIPAILAAGNATEKIHDGDMVMVDGDTGKAVVVSVT